MIVYCRFSAPVRYIANWNSPDPKSLYRKIWKEREFDTFADAVGFQNKMMKMFGIEVEVTESWLHSMRG